MDALEWRDLRHCESGESIRRGLRRSAECTPACLWREIYRMLPACLHHVPFNATDQQYRSLKETVRVWIARKQDVDYLPIPGSRRNVESLLCRVLKDFFDLYYRLLI